MSFEGYYQLLCKHGHMWYRDCTSMDNASDYDCLVCKGKPVWWNIVDQTNGICEEDSCIKFTEDKAVCENCNDRIDGKVFLELDEEKSCRHCNSVLSRKYKIPKGKGHLNKEK